MRKRFVCIALLSLALALPQAAIAQKKAMTHDVYDSWQSVSNVQMSADGKVVVYEINPQEGDGKLFIKNNGRELVLPRADRASIDPDGSWLYCHIKPEFAKNRRERIKKLKKEKMTPDTLAIVNLKEMNVLKYGSLTSYATGVDSRKFVACRTTADEDVLAVFNPAAGLVDTLKHVGDFHFSRDGSKLAYVLKKEKKDSSTVSAVVFADLSRWTSGKFERDTIATGAKVYKSLVFDDAARQFAFAASKDSSDSRSFSVFYAGITYPKKARRAASSPKPQLKLREIFTEGTMVKADPKTFNVSMAEDGKRLSGEELESVEQSWTVNENSGLFFSKNGSRLFTGIGPISPKKDTSIVDFEHPELDIWNWDAIHTPPQQRLNNKKILSKTYPAVINLSSTNKIVSLTQSYFDDIVYLNGGESEWALSSDEAKYERSSVWDYRQDSDLSLVNLNTGERKPVYTKFNGPVRTSPAGKYLLLFNLEDGNWHTYDIARGIDINLTGRLGVNFFIEDDDHPTFKGAYEENPLWTENDEYVLVSDRYDVWKLKADGTKAVNLTNREGVKNHVRFHAQNLNTFRWNSADKALAMQSYVPAKGDVYLSAFHELDMRNGFGKTNIVKAGTPEYVLDTVTFITVQKAENSRKIAFRKGNFRNCYDLYTTEDEFRTEERLTAINPQKEEYRWGRVELMEWKAYDGTPLKGLVFLPDGMKEDEKLPVMVYFYEMNSHTMYNWRTPAPSRSIVNIAMYVSNGYICFVPDIKYTVGYPGQSAYNCICSGAEALCEKYTNADKSKMAIQGQSWGGYQTAWLVTRTNMFAAAGAGAPVSNMTSAYGGIRWGSGITRAGQYEHGQSRIGKSLWDEGGLNLYIENSPVFKADKVETPLLIMHNDADGAVPWYQGIEYFSDLRRLNKPVWMLQYNKEAHNLVQRRNCKDLSIRLQQFFDHYLKGAPAPAWMKDGVPYYRKSQYLGY